ncbi:MAG TPA: putative lipid II flippase FtsW [Thermoanaerobaculia bacterium]|nr:putative lipid II flippase FtsW [Thermoanaerobaculia bacterium]
MSRKLSYDRYIFGAAILILVVGLVMIYSASALIAAQKIHRDDPYYFVVRQCIWLLAGSGLMFFLMNVDTNRFKNVKLIYGLLLAICVALVVVLFQAPINGTHRWIVLPAFQVQPSEFAKPVMVLFLASYLSRKEDRIDDLTGTLLPLGTVMAIVAGLILLEPDFGTAATIVVVASSLLFVAGISWKRIALFSLALVPAAIALIMGAEYRRDRLLTFLNPEADPLGKGFQAMQSLIAIGTGGLTGLGIGNGRQKLFFLPEPHTDFIFSIIGEEVGFIGAFALLAVFTLLVWRGFRLALQSANDRFAYYAILGFTLMIGFQVLLNVSVTLCLLPTKGLPLPLVSYGGSSLITSLCAVGMLLNFSQRST